MPSTHVTRRRVLQTLAASAGVAAWPSVHAQSQSTLPVEVFLALKRVRMNADAMVAVVQDVGSGRSRLSHGAQTLVNPASLEKLVTTQAALELLGPAWTWVTPVWLDGVVEGDVLTGRVVIKGSGDPKLVAERLWLLGQRLRQSGVREIRGDIVIDQSAFDIPEVSPAQFDNEPLRPYNVQPAAFLLAQKSQVVTFTPHPARGVATVHTQPELRGVGVDATVALSTLPCDDWRARLQLHRDDVSRLRFQGTYPASCGERSWPMAFADPATYHARVLESMWAALGGVLTGAVLESRQRIAPRTPPSFEFVSPPLSEVVRDINKHSNNTMAQQLFLTLAAHKHGTATWQGSRDVVNQWLTERVRVSAREVQLGNGAGLSRDARLSASALARVLQQGWRSPAMPDLLASLPASGLDGTMRRSRLPPGRAHLKTGSLRDVAGVAGYVLAESGRRYVVVAIVNHDAANEARPALDALVQWVSDDSPQPT